LFLFFFYNMLFLLKGLEDLAWIPKLKNLNRLIACWERSVCLLHLALDLEKCVEANWNVGKWHQQTWNKQ